ncbi:MAG: T9SS type A sorting domain-containing protein, partial [Bacteroidota bacterium]
AADPILDLQVEGAIGEGFRYLIVDADGMITAIESDTPFEIAFQGNSSLLVYGLGYNGTLLATVGSRITDNLVDGCFELSADPVILMEAAPEGGSVQLAGGENSATFCPDEVGTLEFEVSGNSDEETQYLLITNEDNEFLRAFEGTSFDFSAFGDGLYHIWSVNASGSIVINEGDDVTNTEIASQCYDLSDNFVTINRMDPIGGEVITISGGATVFACPDQGTSNIIEFETIGTKGTGMLAYILTDENDLILSLSGETGLDLGGLAGGAYKIYGLTYNGMLNNPVGENVKEAALASSCFELSSNVVEVNLAIPTGGSITGNGLSGDKVCINNVDNAVDLEVLGRSTNTAYTFIVANDQNQFLFSIMDEPITLDFLFQGDLKVWGLAYTGDLTINPFDDVLNTVLSDDCFDLSENALTIVKEDIDGGMVSVLQGGTEAFACPGDGNPDIIEVRNSSTSPNANYTYIITTADNNILSPMESGSRDFDNIGAFSEVRIWGLSYTGALNLPIFQNVLSTDLSDGCFDLSDNFVTLYRDEPEAGEISTDLGSGDLFLCPGAVPDILNLVTTSTSTAGYVYILTDANSIVQQIITDAQLNVRDLAMGDYVLHGVSYTGNLTVQVGDDFSDLILIADNCHELTNTPISLTRGAEVDGGRLSTVSGDTLIYTCPGDFRGDVVFVIAPDPIPGTSYRIVVTGPDNSILFPNIEEGNIPFDGVAAGEYRIWGVSFTGEYRGQFGQDILNDVLSTDCYTTSENFITVVSVNPDAGAINTADGRLDISVDADNDDALIQLENTSVSNAPYLYLLTSMDGTILDIYEVDTLNTARLADGVYRIYGANHAGNFIAEVGDNIFNDPLADNCFSITPNNVDLVINRGDDGGTVIGEQVLQKKTGSTVNKQEQIVEVFPNPVRGETLNLRVNWVNQIEKNGELSIFDMSGKLILRQVVDLYVGQQQFQVEVKDLNRGMYIIQLVAGEESLQRQLVKQ